MTVFYQAALCWLQSLGSSACAFTHSTSATGGDDDDDDNDDDDDDDDDNDDDDAIGSFTCTFTCSIVTKRGVKGAISDYMMQRFN